MQDLFDRIEELNSNNTAMNQSFATDCRQFEVRVSYLEIYNELVYDLLDPNGVGERPLTINESRDKHFLVKGITEIPVLSIQEVLQLIQLGEQNRSYAETQLNHHSSRSHTLFRLSLVQYTRVVGDDSFMAMQSYLNFVDLAGSEKITNYFGSDPKSHKKADNCMEVMSKNARLKEGLSINKSLFNLTQVIHTLS